MAQNKVGTPTGQKTTAGRPVYKTSEGKSVSELSVTIPINGKYYNAPSIYNGKGYSEEEVRDMLVSGKVKPTSVHSTLEEAISAAKERSDGLLSNQPKKPFVPRKYQNGGDVPADPEGYMFGQEVGRDPERDKAIVGTAADFTPIVGEAKSAIEGYQALRKGDYAGAAMGAIGAVPGIGMGLRAAKKVLKSVDTLKDATDKVEEGVDAFKKLNLDDASVEAWKKANAKPQRQTRVPEVQEAAQKLKDRQITSEEYLEIVKQKQPIRKIEEMPAMPSKEEIAQALEKNQVQKGIIGVNKKIKNGTRVASRLDIPAYNAYDTWVVSLHDGTKIGGDAIGYGQTAVLKNVEFKTAPKGALNIATGAAKNTIARIHGDWLNKDPDDVYKYTESILNDPEWVQVGMNPFRHSFFYDKADGMPVISAEEVVQVGPLVMARGVKKTSPTDPMFRIDKNDPDSPTFNKGGTVKKEMTRLFEDGGLLQEGGAVDPVSGNDVPVGSTKEEVRDDIPAQLSEGEFVFPADVVRFIGLEKLMQIRQAAKEGLAKMERMGQMGNSDEATEDDTGEFETEIDDILSEMDSKDEDDDSEDEEVSSVKKPDEERLGFAIGGVAPPAPVYGMQRFTKEGEPDKYVPTTNDQLRLAAPEGFTKATETPGKVGKIDVGSARQEALQTYKTKYAPKVEDVLGKPVTVADSGLDVIKKTTEDQTKDLFGGVDIKGKKVEAGNIKSMLGEVDDEEGKTYTRDEAIARMTSQFRKQYDFLNKNAGYKYKHEGDLDTIFRKQAEELYDASGGTLASIYDVDIKEAEVPVDQRIRTDGTLIQEKDDEGNPLGTYAYYYEVPEADGTRREVISGIKSDQVTADGNYIDPDAATTSKYIINKKTGEQIKLGKYEGAVQDWQGGFTRFGYNTGVEGMAHYGITKDKFGNPIYYPVYEDTSDKAKIAQIAGMALTFLAPGAGTALGAALGAGATFAPIIGNALIQGTLAEVSGGDFLKGAAIGAITGGTQTPAFKDFAGSVGASILGEGVKGAETLGAVITNASVNGIVAAITGADVGKSMLIGGIKGGIGANIEDITNSVIGANGTKAIADALNISTKEVQNIFGNSLVGGAVSLAQGKSYFQGFMDTLIANGLSSSAAGTIAKNLQGKTDPATLKRITNTTRLVTNLAIKAKQKGLDFETLLQAQWPAIVATSLKGIGGKG